LSVDEREGLPAQLAQPDSLFRSEPVSRPDGRHGYLVPHPLAHDARSRLGAEAERQVQLARCDRFGQRARRILSHSDAHLSQPPGRLGQHRLSDVVHAG
jgi:hypothetical protein